MDMSSSNLEVALQIAAAMQLGIAILNLFLVRLIKWKVELGRMPLLIREVFHVHSWFISVTLTIFAVMTLRFAGEMSSHVANSVYRWLAGCIGIFWGFRTILQVAYYSSSHWRGNIRRIWIHIALLFMYGGFAVAYLISAFGVIK
ncbi:hypothetical protein [Pedosphaera parvula]|uniref:Cytochrome b561 domain-containing protein n=1 Tax=Pedosphaera parvula (strain Ellin514) TaxID=320771 RepID=B9XGN7_PEDPL|nr:hypothetical protein [Pedosphaera parvula]EEF61088.1 hypothetical protein Cflav_PD3805 [Pedosphaera parvula Ellin514]